MFHHRGADQETVGKVAEFAHLSVAVYPGFADHRDARAQTRRKLARTVEVNRQVAQVAVVNADHFGFQRDGALQLLFVAHFGQHAHIQAVRDGGELAILLVIQHGEHQQAGIGLVKARQPDLIRVDNKVFAQNRLRRDAADYGQKIEAALKIFLIRQHRNGRRMMLVDTGNTRRVEIVTDHAFGRRRFFTLQNKRGTRALERIIKTTAARNDVILKTGERLLLLAGFHPDGLIGDDFR